MATEQLNENGMVVDFSLVKDVIMQYDHQNFNKMPAFNDVQPTAENIARILSQQIQEKLDLEMNKPIVYTMEVWETPNTKIRWELDTSGVAG